VKIDKCLPKQMTTTCPHCEFNLFYCKCDFDYKLAIMLSKIVHEKCKDVPHDIGINLAREVYRLNEKKEE